MKISKYLVVDQDIKMKKMKLKRIKNNKSNHNLYLVCTPKNSQNLFEIIQGNQLDESYNEAYLIALTGSREKAIQCVKGWVNQIYNLERVSYKELKVE